MLENGTSMRLFLHYILLVVPTSKAKENIKWDKTLLTFAMLESIGVRNRQAEKRDQKTLYILNIQGFYFLFL